MTESDSVRLARIEEKLDAVIRSADKKDKADGLLEERTASLERWRSQTKGALAVISMITGGLLARLLST